MYTKTCTNEKSGASTPICQNRTVKKMYKKEPNAICTKTCTNEKKGASTPICQNRTAKKMYKKEQNAICTKTCTNEKTGASTPKYVNYKRDRSKKPMKETHAQDL